MQQVTLIQDDEWDSLVKSTYGKPYCFQQQAGCRDRGTYYLSVPCEDAEFYDQESNEVPEVVNHATMQTSFKSWLERDATKLLETGDSYDRSQQGLELWWERNFYPAPEMLANDLHQKGLLPAGKYIINIDW